MWQSRGLWMFNELTATGVTDANYEIQLSRSRVVSCVSTDGRSDLNRRSSGLRRRLIKTTSPKLQNNTYPFPQFCLNYVKSNYKK